VSLTWAVDRRAIKPQKNMNKQRIKISLLTGCKENENWLKDKGRKYQSSALL
jgi:hypothetical protein